VSGEGPARMRPHPWIARAITVGGLAICAIVAFRSSPLQLEEPLTYALLGCAVCAAVAYVDFEETIFIDASIVPLLLAAIFLGPSTGFVLAILVEAAAWARQRYRVSAALINALATGGPNLIAAEIFQQFGERTGVGFYVAIACATGLSLVLNFVLLVGLLRLLDGRPLRMGLASWRRVIPAFVLNAVLVIAAANVYVNVGLGAVVFVLVVVLAFAYLLAEVFAARERADRIADLAESKRRLVAQALGAEDHERRRMADSLHDGPVQDLMAARQELAELEGRSGEDHSRLDHALERAVFQLRKAVAELHPAVLERRGVGRALEDFVQEQAERAGFTATLEIDPVAARSPDRLVYAITRELVTNAAKHSKASHLQVRLTRKEETLSIFVQDDGQGMDESRRRQAAVDGHVGLASIEDRIDALGGKFAVKRPPQGGTACEVDLPLSRLVGADLGVS
jgi:signal transduction histidine kinase